MSEAARRWRSDEINRKNEQKKKIFGEVQSSERNVGMKTMKWISLGRNDFFL